MYRFKNKLYNLLVNCSFALLLSSCGAGLEKQKIDLNEVEGNSPFRINEITGDSRTIYKNGLPSVFILDLKTCVKDSIRKDVSLQDISFSVEYDTSKKSKITKETVHVSTNEDGCIRWSEHYEYKYVTQPLWIGLSRSIRREEGAYAGQVFVRTAVNPWLGQNSRNPIIMDLRPAYYENNEILKKYTYKKEGLLFLTSAELEYPQLWASRIDVQMDLDDINQDRNQELSTAELITKYKTICSFEKDKNCFSRKLSMRLTIPLELRTLDLEKQLQDNSINGGTYKIKAQLVSQYPSGHSNFYRIHEKILEQDNLNMGNQTQANQSTKFLNASFHLKIPYINKNANNKVIIEVESKDLPFKKFQGVYTLRDIELGVVKKFNIDSFLDEQYKPILDEKYKSDKDKVVDVIENMNIQYVYEVAKKQFMKSQKGTHPTIGSSENYSEGIENQLREIGFNPAHLDATINAVRFSNIKNNEDCSTNESVVKKTIQYVGKVCFKDFLKNNYEQTIFRVFRQELDSDGKAKDKSIELFKKDKTKAHHSADANGCISFSDEIKHNNYNRQTYFAREMHFFSETLNLYGKVRVAINPWQEAFQFYQDITQIGHDKIRTNPEGVDRPHLVINQFRGVNFFPTYIIDKLLNIHLFQNLYFLFQPIVTRHDSVSRGKHSRSREYLRDGYYLLRLLVTRSPQETQEHPRIISKNTNNKIRKEIVNNELAPQFKDGHYITHVDTLIKAEANFTNMYVPVQFNKQQLYYVGSRNRIILQMVPADPKYYKYKKLKKTGGVCKIDLEKTQWKPYLDHDLVTYPHAGPYTPQDWVNWNILRSASHLRTDEIIAQSEEGKSRQLFNMDPVTCNFNPSKACDDIRMKNKKLIEDSANIKEAPIIISKGLPNKCSNKDLGSIDITDPGSSAQCFSSDTNELVTDKMKDHLKNQKNQNIYDQNKKSNTNNQLEEFALENALVVIDLSDHQQRDKIVKDLNQSSDTLNLVSNSTMDYKKLDSTYTISDYKDVGPGFHALNIVNDHLLSQILNPDVKAQLTKNFRENCMFLPGDDFYSSDGEIYGYQECAVQIVRNYNAENIKNNITEFNNMDDFVNHSDQGMKRIYYPAKSEEEGMIKMTNLVLKNSSDKTLKQIVNSGVRSKNAMLPTMGSFTHSLCQFWFDKYTKEYLTSKQMRAAYANSIRKHDYHAVLESHLQEGKSLNSYFKEIHNWIPKNESVKVCHNQYTQCILSDYCKERGHSELDSQCESLSDNFQAGQSCHIILKKQCELDPSNHLCTSLNTSQISEEQCHEEFALHCNSNPQNPLCYQYKNRCLVNYYDCTGEHKDYFTELIKKSPFNNKDGFLKTLFGFGTEGPLKTCLADPYKFFEFENKIIVEDINDKHEVIGGYASNFSVTSSLSIGSYLNWTAQKTFATGIKGGVGLGIKSPTAKFGFGIGLSTSSYMNMSASSNESNSARRARDIRLAEGTHLVASKLSIKIGVTQYKKCLVIKPKANSFTSYEKDGLLEPYNEAKTWNSKFHGKDFKKMAITRTGLMICNPSFRDENKPLNILEDYYYITQAVMNPNNSEFLNLYDIINRPFMLVLRGRREFVKMLYLLQNVMEGDNRKMSENAYINKPPSNQFIHYSHPVEEVVGLNLTIREFNETGFHDGIYTYPRDIENLDVELVKKKSGGVFKKITDTVKAHNPFDIPSIPQGRIPIQE